MDHDLVPGLTAGQKQLFSDKIPVFSPLRREFLAMQLRDPALKPTGRIQAPEFSTIGEDDRAILRDIQPSSVFQSDRENLYSVDRKFPDLWLIAVDGVVDPLAIRRPDRRSLVERAVGQLACLATFDRQVRPAQGLIPTTTRYVSTVRYEYRPSAMKLPTDRIENPFGFVVTSYRADAELVPPARSGETAAGAAP